MKAVAEIRRPRTAVRIGEAEVVRRLRAKKLTYDAIAAKLGIPTQRVWRYCNPGR